jgi:hypothetical protein
MGVRFMTYYPIFLQSIHILDCGLDDLADQHNWTLENVLFEHAAVSGVCEA